jgi:hypothetical protein
LNSWLLDDLHKLCPNITSIDFITREEKDKEDIKYFFHNLSRFQELRELTIPNHFEVKKYFKEFLKSKETHKLEKLNFDAQSLSLKNYENFFDNSDEFYKLLFEKTNLIEFQRIPTELEYGELLLLCDWLDNKSTIKKLDLNCKKVIN